MRVALLAVLCCARTATAGPWCGGGPSVWAPADHHVPVHPHLVLVRSGLYYAGKQHRSKLLPFTATIDGKRVEIATRNVDAGEYQLAFVEIKSDRAGTLKLSYAERQSWAGTSKGGDDTDQNGTVEYTLDPKWSAPAKAVATVTRYHQHIMLERESDSHDYDGAVIAVDVPAIAFTVRWRRDAKDGWRAMELPALDEGGRATVRMGQTKCAVDSIPLGLMEKGIELEVVARLPNGKTMAVEGIAKPFVVPPATMALPLPSP